MSRKNILIAIAIIATVILIALIAFNASPRLAANPTPTVVNVQPTIINTPTAEPTATATDVPTMTPIHTEIPTATVLKSTNISATPDNIVRGSSSFNTGDKIIAKNGGTFLLIEKDKSITSVQVATGESLVNAGNKIIFLDSKGNVKVELPINAEKIWPQANALGERFTIDFSPTPIPPAVVQAPTAIPKPTLGIKLEGYPDGTIAVYDIDGAKFIVSFSLLPSKYNPPQVDKGGWVLSDCRKSAGNWLNCPNLEAPGVQYKTSSEAEAVLRSKFNVTRVAYAYKWREDYGLSVSARVYLVEGDNK